MVIDHVQVIPALVRRDVGVRHVIKRVRVRVLLDIVVAGTRDQALALLDDRGDIGGHVMNDVGTDLAVN